MEKTLLKAVDIEKREKKVAKIEWRNEMRNTYGSSWTKRSSARIQADGCRRLGRLV